MNTNTMKSIFATPKYLKNVTTLALDTSKCNGCGRCVDVCPHAVFAMDARKSKIVNRDSCMECGACSKNCATGALNVNPGVGCAAAIIQGWVTGKEPSCDCGTEGADGADGQCCSDDSGDSKKPYRGGCC